MKYRVSAAMAAIAVATAACATPTTQETAASTTSLPTTEMAGMMGDPTATPADLITGAVIEAGAFALLPDATPGHERLNGTAMLARHEAGTTVTLELDGLIAGTQYVAHVHTGACADGGGPHYRHDPGGSDMPPNEIHLGLDGAPDGSGTVTVENESAAGLDAASVVVHVAGGDKLACADLAPAGG